MNKIITFVNKYKYLLIVLSIILVIIIFVFNKKGNTKNVKSTPSPASTLIASYKNLVPGSSSKEEVLAKLGTALNAKIEGGKETYEYPSSNPNFNTEIVILDNKLSYIKVVYTINDNTKYEDFINLYGEPEKILYGSDYLSGYILNSSPQKGLAFISHQKSHNVREAWYFSPTDIDTFMKDYAIGYSDKIKEIQ